MSGKGGRLSPPNTKNRDFPKHRLQKNEARASKPDIEIFGHQLIAWLNFIIYCKVR